MPCVRVHGSWYLFSIQQIVTMCIQAATKHVLKVFQIHSLCRLCPNIAVSRPLIGHELSHLSSDWLNISALSSLNCEESLNLQTGSYENTPGWVSGFQQFIIKWHKSKSEATRQIFYIGTQIQIGKISCWFFCHKCYPSSRLLSSCVIITQSNIFPENIFITFCPNSKTLSASDTKKMGTIVNFQIRNIVFSERRDSKRTINIHSEGLI